VPFTLINKIERLIRNFPEGVCTKESDLTNDASLMLDDNILDLLEDIVDAARDEFGMNVPPIREANIMESKGYPVRFTESKQVTGKVPSIFTPIGFISYR